MTDKTISGKPQKRLVLAPHLSPAFIGADSEKCGRFFYLSWPGWELYLRRRLGIKPEDYQAEAILLPDEAGPEADFAAIDQLARKAAQLGAGLLGLLEDTGESVGELTQALRGQSAPPRKAEPILSDRLYLALWTISEHQRLESQTILAEALALEKEMWAELKGEEEEADPGPEELPLPAEEDLRGDYARRCWHRLAGALIGPDDLIIAHAGPTHQIFAELV